MLTVGMTFGRFIRALWLTGLIIGCFQATALKLRAEGKAGMPDLSQVEQTCLPTATANLILWFGDHGYPKLICPGATRADRELNTVHELMATTDARFDLGTSMGTVKRGIERYVRDAGYNCDVEYRGLGGTGPAFDESWLHANNDARKGFILYLAYSHWNPGAGVATPAWGVGHAVTLDTCEPGLLVIHDPAHLDDETGRKILTSTPLTGGTWQDENGPQPLAGLLRVSGTLLRAPEHSEILVIGAVCISMRAPGQAPTAPASKATTSAVASLGADGASGRGWWSTLYRMLFAK